MANFKFVKSATALVLGASVLTTAVVAQGTSASAKTTYKVTKSGTLVNAKTNKTVKGYASYKGKLYSNGKKLTGLYKGKYYYKSGVKASGTYKGAYYYKGTKKVTTGTYNSAYYYKGVKKVTTGTYNKAYYVKGVKKVTTGTYNGAYYVSGVKKVTTGTYASAYYVKGVKKVTTGTYNGAYYVNGKNVVATGTYDKAYFVDGKKVVETGLYDSKYYKEGVLNVGLALFEGKLYDGAELNKGLDNFEDKYYFDADLADGTYDDNGVEKAFENGVEVGAKVKSVEAINAAQVKVTFNKSIDKETLFADGVSGALVANVLSIKAVNSNVELQANYTGELSKDGKTLVLTSTTTTASNRHVVVLDNLKTPAKESVAKYDNVVDFGTDTVAPTIQSVEKLNGSVTRINFSEPVKGGTFSYKLANGAVVTGITTTTVGATPVSYVDVNLSTALSAGTDVAAGQVVTATIVGLQDASGNLLNPNPATVDLTEGAKDGVKPTVASVTQSGNKELVVNFSEGIYGTPTISLNGVPVLAANIKQDEVDKTKFVVTAPSILNGATTVAVSAFNDFSGETGDSYSRVYTFAKTDVTSAVQSSKVVKDATDGKEYLEITFDKNVDITGGSTVTASGSNVKNYVTTALTGAAATVTYKDAKDHKVVRVALADLLAGAGDDVADAKYSTTLTFATVTSESGKAVATAKAEFTRGTDSTVSALVPTTFAVTPVVGDNNKLLVKFDQSVDLATATDASNYTVSGAEVVSATHSSAEAADEIVLTLKANSNTFTGARNVTVKNVKALNGTKAMDTKTVVSSVINENVAPTFTAQLTATNQIKLVFSENVAADAIGDAIVAGDFAVLYDNNADVVSAITSDGTTPVAADKTYKTIYLTLTDSITDTAKSLTVSASGLVDVNPAKTSADTLVLADLIGNAPDATPVSVNK